VSTIGIKEVRLDAIGDYPFRRAEFQFLGVGPPVIGIMTVVDHHKDEKTIRRRRYAVALEWTGPATGSSLSVKCTKSGGKELYRINLALDPREDSCDCPAGVYKEKCTHAEALRKLLSVGGFDPPT